jgi:hypothetical protein
MTINMGGAQLGKGASWRAQGWAGENIARSYRLLNRLAEKRRKKE